MEVPLYLALGFKLMSKVLVESHLNVLTWLSMLWPFSISLGSSVPKQRQKSIESISCTFSFKVFQFPLGAVACLVGPQPDSWQRRNQWLFSEDHKNNPKAASSQGRKKFKRQRCLSLLLAPMLLLVPCRDGKDSSAPTTSSPFPERKTEGTTDEPFIMVLSSGRRIPDTRHRKRLYLSILSV